MSVDTGSDTSISNVSTASARSSRSRIPLPSPSRPRLDPQYVARLASGSHHHHHHQQRPLGSSSTTTTTTTLSSPVSLPPPIHRASHSPSIFRPITSGPDHHDILLDSPEGNGRSFTYSTVSPTSSVGVMSSASSCPSVGTTRRYTTRFRSDIGQSDRFIPSRATSNFNLSLWERDQTRASANTNNANMRSSNDTNTNDRNGMGDGSGDTTQVRSSTDTTTQSPTSMFNSLLRSELLGENVDPTSAPGTPSSYTHPATDEPSSNEGGHYFRFQSPRQAYHRNVFDQRDARSAVVDSFSLAPVGSATSQRLMSSPQKRKRRIQKVPFKVLDAPALQDDFYLNLVDWSSQNVLAVGLGSCVYLWSACTSKVTKLCDLAPTEDVVTSVSWAQRGTHLAVGTNRGEVQLWDTIKCKKIRTLGGHSARIGTMSWSGPTLASGSRDRLIYLRDVRAQSQYTHRLCSHKQEVCGLKWSSDEPAHLASGGNDNKLLVWDIKNHLQPTHRFADHTAAVKAIAWSPHQHGLLASGGGTADRCIRFWNTLSGVGLSCIDTGSQVCNLAWSQNCNEIVSTHGYSLNQIVVWRYPSMSKVVTLTGHTYRVLYLAMSPDGSTIVT